VPAARSTNGLTLASAFDLMRRALAELPRPVEHEPLRLRMAALNGRMDPMIEPGRFHRLLRQAHDAEVADVRKIADDEYEVLSRPSEGQLMTTAERPIPEGAQDQAQAPSGPSNGSARGGVRFRRGSRLPAASREIPMVGVVSLEEAPAVAAPTPEKPARSRRGKPKAAPPAEGAAPPTPRKKATRPRTRKAAE
jgi:hypothetical protein